MKIHKIAQLWKQIAELQKELATKNGELDESRQKQQETSADLGGIIDLVLYGEPYSMPPLGPGPDYARDAEEFNKRMARFSK
jgi:hypothetical protein